MSNSRLSLPKWKKIKDNNEKIAELKQCNGKILKKDNIKEKYDGGKNYNRSKILWCRSSTGGANKIYQFRKKLLKECDCGWLAVAENGNCGTSSTIKMTRSDEPNILVLDWTKQILNKNQKQ